MTNTPVLVTGIHRSGTTFVGRILASASGVGYVQEPFNPKLGIEGIDTWYKYIRKGMADEEYWAEIVARLLQGKARYRKRPGTHGGPLKTAARKLLGSRDYLVYLRSSRLPGTRKLLLKDPLAALSAKWLHDRFHAKVIALLRHPAGFAASTARLGWDYNFFQFLLSQDDLMRDYLSEILNPYDLTALSQPQGAALLWRCIYTILEDYSKSCPGMKLIKLEDISEAPVMVFKELFGFSGIPFTEKTEQIIQDATSVQNPVSAPAGEVHSLKRNSRGLSWSWKKTYSQNEIADIIELAGPLAAKYYPS